MNDETPNSRAGSVTHWLGQLKANDPASAQRLWDRYIRRLVRLARKKLQDRLPGLADEEDVALSAFNSFFRSAKLGRFEKLEDRNDLWQLLVMVAARKIANLRKHEARQKRNVNRRASDVDVEALIGREPTPDFAAQVAEELERAFRRLGDEELCRIAQRKMAGFTNKEIAVELKCVERSVERKLRLIRRLIKEDRP